eukprot:TRINITY_DN25229_c3_g1_i2.p1 TRINITY_DN25229_c3_g1~~TRINITY_DN25229_c3_g1_i2.p1  ORF type:complete len:339 (+),score=107.14 TRINITY_DN25229_c3_g1_i2:46-1062(+)
MAWAAGVAASNVFECPAPPTESISSLAWAPAQLAQQKNFLAVGSWDKSVRVYDVQKGGTGALAAAPVNSLQNTLPVLDTSISPEGDVYFGGCCNTAKVVSLAQPSAPRQVAQHDLAVKSVKWCNEQRVLATGSWDGKVKLWDTRSQTPGKVFECNGPIVDMDVTGAMLTVATARMIYVYDLNTMAQFKQTPPQKSIREQLRCVANFIDKSGFAMASIEGRAALMWFEGGRDFSFKCHRDKTVDVFSVNCISFHPRFGTFATCGSNGTVTMWDGPKKQKVSTLVQPCHNTIPCGAFDSSGSLFAYAVSYDWTKGAANYNPQLGHKICIKPIQDSDVCKY